MSRANIKKFDDPNLWIYEHVIKKGKQIQNDSEFNKELLKKAREKLKLILKDSKKYDTKLKELDNRKHTTLNYMRANKKIDPNSFIFNPYKEKNKSLDIKNFFNYQNEEQKYNNNNSELCNNKDMSNVRNNLEGSKKKHIINIMDKIKESNIKKISFFFNNHVNYYDTHLKEKYMNEILKKNEKKNDIEKDDIHYSIINNEHSPKTQENNYWFENSINIKDGPNLNSVKNLSHNISTETVYNSSIFNEDPFDEDHIIDNGSAETVYKQMGSKERSSHNLNDKNINDVEKKRPKKNNNSGISEKVNTILLYNNMGISSDCTVGGSNSLLSILEKLKEKKNNKNMEIINKTELPNFVVNNFEETLYHSKEEGKKNVEIKDESDKNYYYKKGVEESINKIKEDEKRDNSSNQYKYLDSNNITIYNLSKHINIDENKIINVCKYILDNDYISKYTKLEKEVAELICEELNVLDKLKYSCIDLKKRNPIVTILGHVDHGKTTLLDCFRNSNIAKNEVGGITQKLGAFEIVDKKKKKKITFLDTPGHNVFKTIRKRCVQCTDLIVLVISAEDGIMNETIECLELAQKYNIPLIIAVNKIDKCNSENDTTSKIETLSKALLRYNIITENENGHVPIIPISAKKNINIDLLQNTIFNVSDKLNLMSDYGNLCSAYLLEKKVDQTKGKILTVICKSGILKVGAYILVDHTYTKIKKIYNSYDKPVKEAYPSEVAQIVCPISFTDNNNLKYGDMILEMSSLKNAQRVAKYKLKMAQYNLMNEAYLEKNEGHGTSNSFVLPQIPIIIKTCDEGSLSAILEGLNEYSKKEKNEKYCNIFNFVERNYINKNVLNDEKITDKDIFKNWKPFKIITKGVGTLNISDLKFCEYINPCFIFSFNIDINSSIQKNIDNMNGIILRSHNIIYELFNDIENICNFYFDSLHLYEPVSKMTINKTGYYSIKNSKGNSTKKSRRVVLSVDIKEGVCNSSHTYNIIRNKEIIHKNLTILSMQKNKQNTNELTKTCNANAIIFNTSSEDFLVGDEIIALKKTTRPPLFGKIKSFDLAS
ncbi:translation initiation factor IF-2, putative [Plasmodium vinckei vinckei]|uniref:Translation initiation factor IF-2, putative n=1 Tax=Plasmodium vinckei vinckei TaxID=54757 RepID=A0A449BQL5_PLAVN|nr:translation initiation factor IF-2, putative [Plasmodium vinckei vinckei]VEV55659.1 translation initiation factor IF-2, putative [Plasmodium vinckei vinckei]